METAAVKRSRQLFLAFCICHFIALAIGLVTRNVYLLVFCAVSFATVLLHRTLRIASLTNTVPMTSATLPVAAVQLLDPVPEQEQLVAGPAQNMETPVHQPSPQQQPSQPAQPPSKPIPIHTNTYEPLTTAASRDMQTRGLNLPEPVHARDGFIRGMLTRNPLRPGPGMQRL